MTNIAVRSVGLGKQYHIGEAHKGYRTLRDSISDAMLAPIRRARKLMQGQSTGAAGLDEVFWALRDVTFDVQFGDTLGIIGRNGAGKSTLLKILSRITEPSEGSVDIFGRVGALLEVGTGFHPELTGRENIYLNGAILGMTRQEIDLKFDEIIAFAEVEKFIETPVKHYSSGMGLRLGFAVAAHMEPEILVVDEVLAVGDAAFQKKCLGKMGQVAGEGRTVLFVSHNMDAIRNICQSAIWLDQGRIREIGNSNAVVTNYLSSLQEGEFTLDQGPVQIKEVFLRNESGEESSVFESGDDITIEVHYHADQFYQEPHFWFAIRGIQGTVCVASMLIDGKCPASIEGDGVIRCRFIGVPLLPRAYTIWMGVRDSHAREKLFPSQEISAFTIDGDLTSLGLEGSKAYKFAENHSLLLPYEWQLPNGEKDLVHITHKSRTAQTVTVGDGTNR